MMLSQFFIWWYGRGWREVAASLRLRTQSVSDAFSVQQLAGTLFAPWRRIVSHPGASLSDHFHAWLDNLVSRFIGFLIRVVVLIAAAISLVAITLVTLVELVIWPCLPFAVIALLVAGVTT